MKGCTAQLWVYILSLELAIIQMGLSGLFLKRTWSLGMGREVEVDLGGVGGSMGDYKNKSIFYKILKKYLKYF